MALLIVAGQTDLQAKFDYVHDYFKRSEAQDQTVKVAICSAINEKRKVVESVCGVQFVHSLSPMFEQSKRQRIQQQLSSSASINKFVWTGDEDTSEELERLKLRLQALIGWDDFPSDLELRDVHTRMLCNVRIEDESRRVEITGEHQACACSASVVQALPHNYKNTMHCLLLEVSSCVLVGKDTRRF